MAEPIILDANITPLKKQLKDATQELQVARQKFGDLSTEAVEAAKKVATIRDSIDAANESAQLFDPGKRFQALTTAASTAAGGIAAAQGAMALFGSQSEDVEKALLKVQGALALSQGLSQLKDIGKVGEQLKISFKGLTAGANGFKKALISTGIGALVVAVGLLVTYWEDILGLVNGVGSEQKKLNADAEENLQVQQDKLDAIDGQSNQLKLQGKSEQEILDLKIAQSNEAIKAAEVNLANSKATRNAQVEAAKRNKLILQGLIAFVSAPITLLLAGIDLAGKALGKNFNLVEDFTGSIAELVFDPEATAEAGDKTIKEAEAILNGLKEKQAGFILSKQAQEKAAADKELADSKAASDKAKASQDKINSEKLAAEKKLLEDQKALQKEKEAQDLEFQKRLNDVLLETRLAAIKDENDRVRAELLARQEQELSDLAVDTKLRADQKLAIQKQLEIRNKQELDALEMTFAEEEAMRNLAELDAEMQQADASFAIQRNLLDQKDALLKEQLEIGILTEKAFTQAVKENSDARVKIDQAEVAAKLENAGKIAGLLSGLSNLIGKETAAGKGFAVASATIDTYLSAQKAYQSMVGIPVAGPALAAVAAGVAIAGGIKNVREIVRTKVPGGGGGVSAPNIAASAPSVTSAVPTIGTSPVTALGTMMQNQPPLRAFVVESEVTNSQKRVADIERRSGF
jgi:hypothetical protein